MRQQVELSEKGEQQLADFLDELKEIKSDIERALDRYVKLISPKD